MYEHSRPKRGPNLANPESEISGVVFNFKSYERAEKRKEASIRIWIIKPLYLKQN